MTTLKTLKSGFVLSGVLCSCFLQISLTLKAIGTEQERLCAEDVLVFLHYLSVSPCNATDGTHAILYNKTQDESSCMVSCYISAAIQLRFPTFSSLCSYQEDNIPSNSTENNLEHLYISKKLMFCCSKQQRHVYIQVNCNYNVYYKNSALLGERCISDEQCLNSNILLKCTMNRCSCTDEFIEYKNQCIHEDFFEKRVPYGKHCLSSIQCTYYGGVCSIDQTCSCISGHVYNKEENICNQVTNLLIGESCTSDRQCNGTENSMACNGVCICNKGYFQLYKTCLKANLRLKEKCTVNRQCDEEETSMACFGGTCNCMPGYIEFNKVCLLAGLTLGTQCKTSLQCTGTTNASICADEICACEPGFIQEEDYCERIKEQYGGTESLQTASDKNDNVLGAAVGAGISGLVIGVLVGFAVMFFIQRRRSGQDNGDETPKRSLEVYETTLQSVSKQDTYEHLENVKEETVTIANTDVSDKVHNVIEPRSTPSDDKLDQHDDGGVYNHLFEKHDETGGGNYDNPQSIRAAQYERKLTEENKITASDDTLQVKREENTEQDNYFVLEKKFN